MNRLHKAKILVHDPIGGDYYRLVLQAPEAASAALPGQFVMLRVSENMDPLLARPFGISSVLSKTSIEIHYRIAGRGTAMLARIEPGHALYMLGPLGHGFPLPGKGVHPVLITGGSGFPPIHFLATRAGSRAVTFIGVRNKACLPPPAILKLFREETAKVGIATEDGSVGTKGIVTDILSEHLASHDEKVKHVMYACGPRPMLEAVSRIASERLIPCYVSVEERMACGLGACMGCSVGLKSGGYMRVCREGPVFDSGEIDWREQVVVPVNNVKR